ncbi:hypothetical protein [Kribbella sp. NBC_00359]|uniref:hypothetical protein n=1 Tax=Kribbella sp. NBC_00359 TaxID=2975966 RepID=UPI002E2199E6
MPRTGLRLVRAGLLRRPRLPRPTRTGLLRASLLRPPGLSPTSLRTGLLRPSGLSWTRLLRPGRLRTRLLC